jgi:hypothetical protein
MSWIVDVLFSTHSPRITYGCKRRWQDTIRDPNTSWKCTQSFLQSWSHLGWRYCRPDSPIFAYDCAILKVKSCPSSPSDRFARSCPRVTALAAVFCESLLVFPAPYRRDPRHLARTTKIPMIVEVTTMASQSCAKYILNHTIDRSQNLLLAIVDILISKLTPPDRLSGVSILCCVAGHELCSFYEFLNLGAT